MRGLSKTMTIGEREITIREPSMIEIRGFLEGQIEATSDALYLGVFRDADEAYLSLLPLLTGHSAKQLEVDFEARFSEIREVLAVAREVAPDFFALIDRLLEYARKQSPPAS